MILLRYHFVQAVKFFTQFFKCGVCWRESVEGQLKIKRFTIIE